MLFFPVNSYIYHVQNWQYQAVCGSTDKKNERGGLDFQGLIECKSRLAYMQNPYEVSVALGKIALLCKFVTPLQIALHSTGTGAQGSPAGVQTTPQNVPSRTGLSHGHAQLDHRPSQRSGSPIGLAKWFGSDVLQQPLPSMPSKVISVDELEYRQWTVTTGWDTCDSLDWIKMSIVRTSPLFVFLGLLFLALCARFLLRD